MMLDAARVAVLVTAAGLPFSTAATNIFMALAVLLWLLAGKWQATARAIGAEPAAWLGWALFLALLLGATWSLAPAGEALGTAIKYRELALFGIVMFLFTEERWRRRLLWVLFGAALVLLAVSYAIYFGVVEYVDPRGRFPQGAVLSKSAITHSFIMSLLAYCAAIIALRQRGWQQLLMLAFAALASINVLAAIRGRTGYVVLAALLVWLAACRWSMKGTVAAVLGLAVAMAAAYHTSPDFQARVDTTVAEAKTFEGDPTDNSMAQRLLYWKRAVQLIAEYPLVGVGTGGWPDAFHASTADDHPFFRDRAHKHPHNEYLFMAAQLGIGGLGLFIALLVFAFKTAGARSEPDRALARGVVIAFAVGCLFNDFLLDATEGHLWAVLGGALFGAQRAPREAGEPAQARASAS